MAHVHHDKEAQEYKEEQHQHKSHAKQYIAIFFLLLFVTIVEVLVPIFAPDFGISKIGEVLILLTLMLFKGAFVVMYYMHLKGDRRMFGSLFIFPLLIMTAATFGFIWLFNPILW